MYTFTKKKCTKSIHRIIFIVCKVVNIIKKSVQKYTKVYIKNIYIWRERNFSQSSKTLKNERI
jgi:hypothetical protein